MFLLHIPFLTHCFLFWIDFWPNNNNNEGFIFTVIGLQKIIIVHWDSILNFFIHLTPFFLWFIQKPLHAWNWGPPVSLCLCFYHRKLLTLSFFHRMVMNFFRKHTFQFIMSYHGIVLQTLGTILIYIKYIIYYILYIIYIIYYI